MKIGRSIAGDNDTYPVTDPAGVLVGYVRRSTLAPTSRWSALDVSKSEVHECATRSEAVAALSPPQDPSSAGTEG